MKHAETPEDIIRNCVLSMQGLIRYDLAICPHCRLSIEKHIKPYFRRLEKLAREIHKPNKRED